jgi:histidine triad (HIT) family protein
MTGCSFCRIVRGDLASSKVYEDRDVLAFMDIQPVRSGQTLVIPKEHIDHFSDIPDDLAQKIFLISHKISRVIRTRLRPERVGLVVHGYGVPHAHMIVVPQHYETDIVAGRMAIIHNGAVEFTMANLPMAPRDELDKIAKLIAFS